MISIPIPDILCESLPYSPITVTTTVRSRGRVSHSTSTICCHLPRAGSPRVTGTLSDGPSVVAWRCEWPLPSCHACSCP